MGTQEWMDSDDRLDALRMMEPRAVTFDYSITYDFEGGTK